MARFQFFFESQTDRLTDKTDCLTPLRACARGVKMTMVHVQITSTMHQQQPDQIAYRM